MAILTGIWGAFACTLRTITATLSFLLMLISACPQTRSRGFRRPCPRLILSCGFFQIQTGIWISNRHLSFDAKRHARDVHTMGLRSVEIGSVARISLRVDNGNGTTTSSHHHSQNDICRKLHLSSVFWLTMGDIVPRWTLRLYVRIRNLLL